jgi:hypothetical protein
MRLQLSALVSVRLSASSQFIVNQVCCNVAEPGCIVGRGQAGRPLQSVPLVEGFRTDHLRGLRCTATAMAARRAQVGSHAMPNRDSVHQLRAIGELAENHRRANRSCAAAPDGHLLMHSGSARTRSRHPRPSRLATPAGLPAHGEIVGSGETPSNSHSVLYTAKTSCALFVRRSTFGCGGAAQLVPLAVPMLGTLPPVGGGGLGVGVGVGGGVGAGGPEHPGRKVTPESSSAGRWGVCPFWHL